MIATPDDFTKRVDINRFFNMKLFVLFILTNIFQTSDMLSVCEHKISRAFLQLVVFVVGYVE